MPTDNEGWILLVGGSAIVADVVTSALVPSGYRVTWIKDDAHIPAALDQGLPGLIILDVMIPPLDDHQVYRRLRADPATASLPILMLMARAQDADKGIESGPRSDDYLVKPFNERELLARVRALLRRTA